MTRNVFVVGLDDSDRDLLERLPEAGGLAFHALFTADEVRHRDVFPVRRLLREARERLQAFPGSVDAVVGYWDFPVSTSLPIIRRDAGLPGPSLEAVLKCEHKYWSRLEQQAVIPECIPAFQAVDPFDPASIEALVIDFPFWIKPVKSVLSDMGFRVADAAGLQAALERIRAGIGRFAEPFNYLSGFARLPREVAAVDGYHCIVEGLISAGHQCTLEGYVHRGEVVGYGLVDSLREGPAGSTFSRYQYPSRLPGAVAERIRAVAARVMGHIGYADGPFNIEFYWDPDSDRLRLLEINTRLSRSQAPLFEMVDGISHYHVMLACALGEDPAMPRGEGEHAVAAKFMVRRYADARVVGVPDADAIRALERAVPGSRIRLHVREGQRLSALRDQDSYSFEVATVFVGGRDTEDLEARYRRCLEGLGLEFRPPAG